MRIVIITQDSPFYLAENLAYLFDHMPRHSQVVGCVLLDPSPFGKRESTLGKLRQTYSVFGLGFFLNYGWRFVRAKLGRGARVRDVLRQRGIPVIGLAESINAPASVEAIRHYTPDLLISVQANVIFKRPVINLAPKGCLNVHTALLPKYRGLMPTFWVMRNGERETGVSVFFVDEGIDSGPILVQKRLEIGDRSLDELIRDTKRIGMDAVIEAVELIAAGTYTLIENRAADQTYYSFPTREDVREFRRIGKRFF
jgi:methionyl-tRNA formyltransferase